MNTYRRIVLAERPRGEITSQCFRLETVPVPDLKPGQILVKNHFLSLDPYMRGRMSERKSYANPQALNETMIGGTVGEVIASENPQWQIGDRVAGMFGWSELGVSDGQGLRRISKDIPMSAYLGVLGMPGMTAWYGVHQILKPVAGKTVVISSASGAVGGTAGQLARKLGRRVVGIAGGPEKCAYVEQTLGFDVCIDYKQMDWKNALANATPDGIDAVFENVGGEIFDASLARMNPFGRIALCGMISGYNGEDIPIRNSRALLTMRLMVQGFIVTEHPECWPQGLSELEVLVRNQELAFRESVSEGLESAPDALIGLLKGRNFGKQLVRF
ncbi:NADP-dependent oxidoreductase [Undibacterium squillarum]|uniref:NADP-dependent oxidoreductase n=2 Tax=Undibacterium squillarum TaxID=1131567 RepID=A0ABQ2XP87_9BURK|nr:NADP-dependent oxidoreductase [Undibacterium squillarum]